MNAHGSRIVVRTVNQPRCEGDSGRIIDRLPQSTGVGGRRGSRDVIPPVACRVQVSHAWTGILKYRGPISNERVIVEGAVDIGRTTRVVTHDDAKRVVLNDVVIDNNICNVLSSPGATLSGSQVHGDTRTDINTRPIAVAVKRVARNNQVGDWCGAVTDSHFNRIEERRDRTRPLERIIGDRDVTPFLHDDHVREAGPLEGIPIDDRIQARVGHSIGIQENTLAATAAI